MELKTLVGRAGQWGMGFPSLTRMVSQGKEVCFRKGHAECGFRIAEWGIGGARAVLRGSAEPMRVHASKWTRSLPLTRPSRACGFALIPFATSQVAQVEFIRADSRLFAFCESSQVSSRQAQSKQIKAVKPPGPSWSRSVEAGQGWSERESRSNQGWSSLACKLASLCGNPDHKTDEI
jgi:hypothetical protein